MKKVLSILLSVAIIATMTTFTGMSALAATTYTTDDGNFTFTTPNATSTVATVTKYNGAENDVVIPGTLVSGDKQATTSVIAVSAFSTNTDAKSRVTSIKVPALTSQSSALASKVFQNCTALETVDLSDCLIKSLPTYTFSGCTSLTNVIFNTSLEGTDAMTKIFSYSFQGCTSLQSIDIPDSIVTIDTYSFDGCTSLTSVSLPDNAKLAINAYAFRGCIGLTEFELPANVTTVASNLFNGCSNLETVTFATNENGEPTVTSIGANAFDSCKKLVMTEIPSSVTSIGASAFANCTSITDFTVPAVKTLNTKIFSGCTNLKSLDLSASSAKMTADVVSGCTSLETFKLSSGTTAVTASFFADCKGSIKEIELPSAMTSIASGSLDGCNALETLTISNATSVSTLTSVFGTVIPDSLETVNINGGKVNGSSFEDIQGINITLGSNITSIGAKAFKNSSLASFTIPQSVTSIGAEAFSGCTLETFELPSVCTSMNGAATGIDDLKNVIIGNATNLTSFEDLFGDDTATMDSVQNVEINGGKVNESAFENVQGINITLGSDITSIGAKAFKNSSLASFKIPQSVTSIGAEAFSGCELETFELPSVCTSMDGAAAGITELKNVIIGDATNLASFSDLFSDTIPSTIENISVVGGKVQESAFEGLNINVTLGSDVTEIGAKAFKDSSLQSFTIPETVTKIGAEAFSGCTMDTFNVPADCTSMTGAAKGINGINTILIGNASTFTSIEDLFGAQVPDNNLALDIKSGEIAANQFEGTNVNSVTFESGVTGIGSEAFKDCTIDSIYLPATVVNTANSLSGIKGLNSLTVEKAQNFVLSNLTGTDATSAIGSVTVLNGTIGENAFKNNGVTNVVLGDGVTEVGKDALFSCPNLTSVYINNPDIYIYDNESTITNTDSSSSKLTIYGSNDSSAKAYADKYSKNFANVECINGHSWAQTVVAPTCGTAGYTEVYCTVCGTSYKTNVVAASGSHSFGNNLKYCTVCDAVNPNYVDPATAAAKADPTNIATTTVAKVSNPAKTSIKKLTKKSKSFKVTYKKISAARGYEIQYSTSKKFTKKTTKTATVKGAKNTTKTIKGLKSKKKYYVRVRTYKKVNGKYYKSSWSKVKTVTTKK